MVRSWHVLKEESGDFLSGSGIGREEVKEASGVQPEPLKGWNGTPSPTRTGTEGAQVQGGERSSVLGALGVV